MRHVMLAVTLATLATLVVLVSTCKDDSAPKPTDVCTLPKEVGWCRMIEPRFFFNATSGRCQRFGYGGCGGNGNNFEGLKDCVRTCVICSFTGRGVFSTLSFLKVPVVSLFSSQDIPESRMRHVVLAVTLVTLVVLVSAQFHPGQDPGKVEPEHDCTLPSKTGMCRAYFPRFFYNTKSAKCEEFVYGGCGANSNNFHTEQECINACVR
ncbi:hypothetical protein ACOMHN_029595 [Nucella lapillus]